ncbi:hypothetical protein [Plebeiibacterium sediminum]|uniref:Lipoprotein n=1 Tax=Plebeiibacterium sediminum TaxID=2992112 RepID=A0AAE3M6L3_9BACT|nr:hypothetical protein [Plebeiobacterium sediminum]MCW3787540.1 hypothetical protein [Plebeiobacterium sediminum]
MKKVVLLPISLLMILSLLTWSCEDDNDDTTGEDSCVRFDSPTCVDLSFSACSDDNGDYYLYEGDKYYCSDYYTAGDANECSGASEQIVIDSGCAVSASSGMELKSAMSSYTSFVLNAMIEVKAQAKEAAGCN